MSEQVITTDASIPPESLRAGRLAQEIWWSEHPVLSIRPSGGWVALNLWELWAHRELLYFLTWRDIKVRYKQTALGAAWAIMQPLLTMLMFTLIFGKLGKLPPDTTPDGTLIPYSLFTLAALVPWTFFASGLNLSANS